MPSTRLVQRGMLQDVCEDVHTWTSTSGPGALSSLWPQGPILKAEFVGPWDFFRGWRLSSSFLPAGTGLRMQTRAEGPPFPILFEALGSFERYSLLRQPTPKLNDWPRLRVLLGSLSLPCLHRHPGHCAGRS